MLNFDTLCSHFSSKKYEMISRNRLGLISFSRTENFLSRRRTYTVFNHSAVSKIASLPYSASSEMTILKFSTTSSFSLLALKNKLILVWD